MRALAHALVVLTAVVLGGCETMGELDANGVILSQRNSEARGGAAAIERIRAVETWLDIREGETRLRGRYLANREGCMRISIYDGDRRILTEGVTSDGVFRDISMEDDVRMAERISAALRRNSESPTQLFGFHELAGRGHRLSMKPPETIYDRNYFRIDVTYKDGLTVEHFIARSDALVELIREHVETDPGARRVETRLTDYRAVAGVLFPFLRTDADIDTLETLGTIRVESLRVNTREALGICEADHTLP